MAEKDSSVFYQLPAVLPVPYRPKSAISFPEAGEHGVNPAWASAVEQSLADLSRWSVEMHSSIYDNYIPQTDRIENMVMVGESPSARPAPIGSRRLFYDRPRKVLYIDVRYGDSNYWDIVFSQDSALVLLDTTNFDKILGPDDQDLQVAMETLDDHIHAADEITTDTTNFSRVLGSTDDEVQHALDTLDSHGHLIFEVASSEPPDSSLNNGEAAFWFVES